MKRKLFISAILLIAMVFLFVACSDGMDLPVNKLGKISIGGNASKAISTVVTYSSEVEDLYWYYKATKFDDGYTTGQQATFVPVVVVDDQPATGLSGKLLNSSTGFSYGFWQIELRGCTSTTYSDATVQYKATITNFLVNAVMNYANADIEVGDNATTKIVFGDIWFTADNIQTTSQFSLAVTDYRGTITVPTTGSMEIDASEKKVTFKNLSYANSETDISGEHTMNFVLSQTLRGTGNTTIEAALYTLKFKVMKGTTTTISGDMVKNDKTGGIQINSFQSVPETIISKVIPVDPDSASEDSARVTQKTTIKVGDLEVTYPVNTMIVPGVGGLSADNSTSDGTVGFKYVDASAPSVQIDTLHNTSAKYELSLSAPIDSENSILITIKKIIGKDLEIERVYHESNPLEELNALPNGNLLEGTTEKYFYDKDNGILYLFVKHASPFYIISKKYVASIGDKRYTTLAAAITASTEGGTIKLLEDTKENVTIPEEKNLTLDMNGKTLNGGTVSESPAIINNGTLVITGNGTIKREDEGTNAYYVIDNQSTLIMKNGTVTNGSGSEGQHAGASLIRNGEDTLGAKLYIEGGQLIQPKFNVIKNGDGQSEVHISGGTISCNQKFAVLTYGPLYISGGDITGPIDIVGWKEGSVNHSGNATISGGKINGPLTVRQYTGYPSDTIPSLTITGGEFGVDTLFTVGEGTSASGLTQKPECGDISITGGTFSSDPSTEYVPKGYCVKEEDGKYYVVEHICDEAHAYECPNCGGYYVAVVTNSGNGYPYYYPSINDMIDDSSKWKKDDAVITVFHDDTFTKQLVLDKNITLDFNGHTLTGVAAAFSDVIQATGSNKTVTIKGGTLIAQDCRVSTSGTTANKANNYKAAIAGASSVTLNIENMTVKSNAAVLRRNNCCNCEVTGCTFSTTDNLFGIIWEKDTQHSTLTMSDSTLTGNLFAYSNGGGNPGYNIADFVKITNSYVSGTITSRKLNSFISGGVTKYCGLEVISIPNGYKIQSKAGTVDNVETLFRMVPTSAGQSDGWTDYNPQ